MDQIDLSLSLCEHLAHNKHIHVHSTLQDLSDEATDTHEHQHKCTSLFPSQTTSQVHLY